jgi:hypothetical protein
VHVRWARWLTACLALMGVQLLLGMAVNLWVAVPARHPGAEAADYFGGLLQGIPWALVHAATLLQLHIVVGIVLWGLATVLAVSGAMRGRRPVAALTIVGWVGVTGAGFNGGSFLNYGHNVSSFLMTVAFVLAAGCYVWALASSRPQAPSTGGSDGGA